MINKKLLSIYRSVGRESLITNRKDFTRKPNLTKKKCCRFRMITRTANITFKVGNKSLVRNEVFVNFTSQSTGTS